MTESKDTTRLDREIVAEELCEANTVAMTNEIRLPRPDSSTADDWKYYDSVVKEKYRQQADYLLSKFRMTLIEDQQ